MCCLMVLFGLCIEVSSSVLCTAVSTDDSRLEEQHSLFRIASTATLTCPHTSSHALHKSPIDRPMLRALVARSVTGRLLNVCMLQGRQSRHACSGLVMH